MRMHVRACLCMCMCMCEALSTCASTCACVWVCVVRVRAQHCTRTFGMFCMHVQYLEVCLFKCMHTHCVSKANPCQYCLRISKTKRKTKIEPHHLFWIKITNVKFTDMVFRLLWVARGWVNAAAAAAYHTRV